MRESPGSGFGEGRNRTRSSPTTGFNILICKAILMLIQQGFNLFPVLPATRPHPVFEEIVEGSYGERIR
jgi:hypothetical protein